MADTFRYERSATIAAPAERIVSFVDDFHAWEKWSPWEKLDPGGSLVKTFTGADKGVGASYAWVGKKSGSGNMTIRSQTPTQLVIDLNFLKPFKASNTAEFTFEPSDGGTKVTWSMTGKKNFMSKVMGLFMNMDKMIGKDFEKGLASLKSLAETK